MNETSLALSVDLARPLLVAALGLGALALVLLVFDVRRARGTSARRAAVGASGAVAVALFVLALLRPAYVTARGLRVGPRVVLLLDASRSMDLPDGSATRASSAPLVISALEKHAAGPRLSVLRFGEGAPRETSARERRGGLGAPLRKSDLSTAIDALARAADERPTAIVVLSDGRLDRPGSASPGESLREALGSLRAPVHTVPATREEPADASIRRVVASGAAVAHQPLSLKVELGCGGALACDKLRVSARELREDGPPTTLAEGTAVFEGKTATVDLTVTLDRSGSRVIEVAHEAVRGDVVRENDRRFLEIDVARDRVRVLHVAGRPTYDVRALRTWLKGDASIDVVAFFILRTLTDDVHSPDRDLALIPFPVDELFSVHLSSFDAVVLQDFDAAPYSLTRYLPALGAYVAKGGGLIMVGGPDAFVPGHYARTALAATLPVSLDLDADASGIDPQPLVPRLTEAGKLAPVLGPLRSLVGSELPEMPGTNVVDDAAPGATVLLEHPTRRTSTGKPMPLLTLGEQKSGRVIALTLDGTHRLAMSTFAADTAGRAHGALWDGLLGWLMRDPKYEPASVSLPEGCIAGEPVVLSVRALPLEGARARVVLKELGTGDVVHESEHPLVGESLRFSAPALEPGGYSASVELSVERAVGARSAGPTARRDFACEAGGDEWADSRPDPERLSAIAKATKGVMLDARELSSLALPEAALVTAERSTRPVLPPWGWTLGAALFLGLHWVLRRKQGLT
jgi:uncharacterized membrane protein